MPTILKPGILVSLKTTLVGGVSYERRDLEREHATETGASEARWETRRQIDDPAEHARATKVRSEASSLIRKVCTASAFGLLCPLAKVAELDAACAAARELCDLHNAAAQSTAVRIYVLRGQIATSDEEAATAIASEVKALLERMKSGIGSRDAAAIREAAGQVKEISSILSDEDAAKVQVSIEAARKAARQLTKAEKPDGKPASEQDLLAATQAVEMTLSRFAFLDVDAAPSSGVVESAEPARALEV